MVLKLYYDVMSQPSRALLIFVRVANIPCEEVHIALRNMEHRTEEYAKINPFQKVPAISHDNFNLTESVAILRYLCRTFSVDDHWYPRDASRQARVDEFMSWQHLSLRAYGARYFITSVLGPVMSGKPINQSKLATYEAGLDEVLDAFENVWLKDQLFVAGNDITIADLLATCELEQPIIGGYKGVEKRPKVQAYMNRVKEKLSPHYQDAHKIAHSLAEKFLRSWWSILKTLSYSVTCSLQILSSYSI